MLSSSMDCTCLETFETKDGKSRRHSTAGILACRANTLRGGRHCRYSISSPIYKMRALEPFPVCWINTTPASWIRSNPTVESISFQPPKSNIKMQVHSNSIHSFSVFLHSFLFGIIRFISVFLPSFLFSISIFIISNVTILPRHKYIHPSYEFIHSFAVFPIFNPPRHYCIHSKCSLSLWRVVRESKLMHLDSLIHGLFIT